MSANANPAMGPKMSPTTSRNMNAQHQQWLLELTGLATAAGCEQRVIAWIGRWAQERQSWLTLTQDRAGNLLLRHRATASDRPLFITAHMDHPAFVVQRIVDEHHIDAAFRGGVGDSYFLNTPVQLWHGDDAAQFGRVTAFDRAKEPRGDPQVTIHFEKPVTAEVGDVVTWNVGIPRIEDGLLHAPACDDLAGVAAALSAFDAVMGGEDGDGGSSTRPDVRLLLTRAEEIGFVGAIAACQAGELPRGGRYVLLENSRSFAESPIGGGPIVRVGDRISTFDPDLTYRLGSLAKQLEERDASFKWQRKLMPGGVCEASAYQAFGYAAACLCLPLGNYHNMNDTTGRIEAEIISLADYHGLVRLLVHVAGSLDDAVASPSLRQRLETQLKLRQHVLDEG